jgi:hypothetical protein
MAKNERMFERGAEREPTMAVGNLVRVTSNDRWTFSAQSWIQDRAGRVVRVSFHVCECRWMYLVKFYGNIRPGAAVDGPNEYWCASYELKKLA